MMQKDKQVFPIASNVIKVNIIMQKDKRRPHPASHARRANIKIKKEKPYVTIVVLENINKVMISLNANLVPLHVQLENDLVDPHVKQEVQKIQVVV